MNETTKTTQDAAATGGLPAVPADPLLRKRVKVRFAADYEGPWAMGIEGEVRAVSRQPDGTVALLIETKAQIYGVVRSRASMITVRPVDHLTELEPDGVAPARAEAEASGSRRDCGATVVLHK